MYRIGLMFCVGFLLQGCAADGPFSQGSKRTTTTPEGVVVVAKGPKTLPQRTETPEHTVTLKGSPAQASVCLKAAVLSTFKIPEEFIETTAFPDGTENVRLLNPATKASGVSIDLRPDNNATNAKMYANGTVIAKAWAKILQQCD